MNNDLYKIKNFKVNLSKISTLMLRSRQIKVEVKDGEWPAIFRKINDQIKPSWVNEMRRGGCIKHGSALAVFNALNDLLSSVKLTPLTEADNLIACKKTEDKNPKTD